jgi:alanyl aminopeptidase
MPRAIGLVLPLASFLAFVIACEAHAPPPPPPARETFTPPVASTTSAVVEQVPTPREDGRLPSLARPRRYALSLQVDPSQDRFQGRATIDVEIANPTTHVVLHGRALSVSSVTATAGSTTLTGAAISRVSHGGVTPEELLLSFPTPLPVGHVVLSLAYDAPFDRELSGLYRVHDGERWYAFTQFETTAARRAFPCFDEPGYKVPFDLQILAPKGMIAVANTPELSRGEASGPSGASTRFDFATSPPLPTYLLAFAVGDFDVREGARSPVPIRLLTVKGKTALGAGALDATAGLVKTLGNYFALPYPFAKLDIVAVPDFAAGAMENPGLIMFREGLVLLDPAHPSVRAKRNQAVTIAHELAHMWFGDLVTMKWWNDLWLNEGFATWMESKATDAWHPDYATHLDAVADGLRVMDTDALASARAVRQPVSSTSEIEESFDSISYQKGAAVLRMIERFVGPEAMTRGVREYLREHAWKSAEAGDLFAALDQASGRDVTRMAATFVDRAGVPSVAMTSTCEAGQVNLALAQSSWRPLGVEPSSTSQGEWRIPVCARSTRGGGEGAVGAASEDACTLLTDERGSLRIPASSSAPQGGAPAGACPAATIPNPGQGGYYRVALAEAEIRALAKNQAELDAAGRIGFLSNLWAQVRAGSIGPDVLLDVLPAFDHETESHVMQALVGTLEAFDHALVDDKTRMPFRTYVATRLWRTKQRLGWESREGEGDDVALLRTVVLRAMGGLAHEPATLREAAGIAARWLKDPGSVDADVASVALPLASIKAGAARFDELRAVIKSAKAPQERITAVTALGAFSDPALLERGWNLALKELRQEDTMRLFSVASLGTPEARESAPPSAERPRAFFRWLQANWEAASALAPAGYEQGLVDVVAAACTKEDREAMVSFLEPRAKALEGVSRPLAENAEEAAACVALRAKGLDAVGTYFRKQAKR